MTSSKAAALAVVAIALTGFTASAQAASNANDAQCFGHIQAGTAEVGSTDAQVAYTFGCDTPITGYQIQLDSAITSFDTATVAYGGDGNPVAADGFTCDGDFPGIAFNCIGTYGATLINNKFETVTGQFSIATKLCTEPRPDPLLTVVEATQSAGVVTQSIAGPFDLGRPTGCPKSPLAGSARIGPDGVPVHVSKPKHKARTKPTAKKAKPKHKTRHARR